MAEVEEANLQKISVDLKSEYEFLDPHVRIDDLSVPQNALLNAIFKYDEMLKIQIDVKRLISHYQCTYKQIPGLEKLKINRISIGKNLFTIMKRSFDVSKVYGILIEFSSNVINVLIDIVNNPINSWVNVLIPHKAELIEIVNRRLIACTDMLELCNEFQPTVLNLLKSMSDIFNELEEQVDARKVNLFLDKCKNLISKHGKNFIGSDVMHRINILLNKVKKMPQKNQNIYKKRQNYNEEESSFSTAIFDWKRKAYFGEANYDNHSPYLHEEGHRAKKTKYI